MIANTLNVLTLIILYGGMVHVYAVNMHVFAGSFLNLVILYSLLIFTCINVVKHGFK